MMRKSVKTIVGILSLGIMSSGETATVQDLDAVRITSFGPKREDYGNGYWVDFEQFRNETGTVHCRENFIADRAYELTIKVGDQTSRDEGGNSQSEQIKAVAGLYLVPLDTYVREGKTGSLKCFPRSAETYSFDRPFGNILDHVPYVIVANKPGAIAGPIPVASVGAVVENATEGGTPAEYLVALNRTYGKPVVLQFAIGGTAKNGADYQRMKKKVTIPAGNISATVVIVPKRDRKAEGTETVILTLKPNKKYGISSKSSATVQITDAP